MCTFFEEVKRRKVYRVATAYIIAGGFLVQMVSAAFPAWELPNWSQRLVIALILADFPIALIFAWIFDITPKASYEGWLYLPQGDKAKAQTAFQRARPFAEQSLREGPNDAARHLELAFILVGLDRKGEAIAEGRRAAELMPESNDAFDGPQIAVALAQIYARSGEKDRALQLLNRLLQTPNGVTAPLLQLDPIWDPLRNDPRFEALIEKYGAKA